MPNFTGPPIPTDLPATQPAQPKPAEAAVPIAREQAKSGAPNILSLPEAQRDSYISEARSSLEAFQNQPTFVVSSPLEIQFENQEGSNVIKIKAKAVGDSEARWVTLTNPELLSFGVLLSRVQQNGQLVILYPRFGENKNLNGHVKFLFDLSQAKVSGFAASNKQIDLLNVCAQAQGLELPVFVSSSSDPTPENIQKLIDLGVRVTNLYKLLKIVKLEDPLLLGELNKLYFAKPGALTTEIYRRICAAYQQEPYSALVKFAAKSMASE